MRKRVTYYRSWGPEELSRKDETGIQISFKLVSHRECLVHCSAAVQFLPKLYILLRLDPDDGEESGAGTKLPTKGAWNEPHLLKPSPLLALPLRKSALIMADSDVLDYEAAWPEQKGKRMAGYALHLLERVRETDVWKIVPALSSSNSSAQFKAAAVPLLIQIIQESLVAFGCWGMAQAFWKNLSECHPDIPKMGTLAFEMRSFTFLIIESQSRICSTTPSVWNNSQMFFLPFSRRTHLSCLPLRRWRPRSIHIYV